MWLWPLLVLYLCELGHRHQFVFIILLSIRIEPNMILETSLKAYHMDFVVSNQILLPKYHGRLQSPSECGNPPSRPIITRCPLKTQHNPTVPETKPKLTPISEPRTRVTRPGKTLGLVLIPEARESYQLYLCMHHLLHPFTRRCIRAVSWLGYYKPNMYSLG